LNTFLSDSHNLIPVAGIVLLAAVVIFFWLRRKPPDAAEIERQRRAYLNRVGRIVEGQILEVVEHNHAPANSDGKRAASFAKAKIEVHGPQRLLYYTYAISGVTYETAQDITGLEERLHLTRVAAGQTASVKYDPANPSNSILLADDWSGLH
jgi:hypothetical protein